MMPSMTKDQINAVLDSVRSWPQEDQEELVEVAREIEARRTGVYALNPDERAAIAEARAGGVASDEEADAFWKRHGVT
jgi:pyridoxal biosynthesis lyase PdxS